MLTVAASGGSGNNAEKPFRTEVAPRIDPVFSDTAGLRETIDQFLALQAEMETVRDQFSGAVHDAMAQMGPVGAAPPKTCPPQIPRMYARAAEAGRRFLALGRRFAARYRDIHRAEDLGDRSASPLTTERRPRRPASCTWRWSATTARCGPPFTTSCRARCATPGAS